MRQVTYVFPDGNRHIMVGFLPRPGDQVSIKHNDRMQWCVTKVAHRHFKSMDATAMPDGLDYNAAVYLRPTSW